MELPTIITDKNLRVLCPSANLGLVRVKIRVQPANKALLDEIANISRSKEGQLSTEVIHQIAALKATRKAYKTFGKDPSRYRPSAEALLRRVNSGKGLYQVNNVVDALNLFSIKTGYSIGGYDFEKIEGAIQWGIGKKEEPYEAIGRGALNIEGLPVLRDQKGAFGSPTSDSTRTMVTPTTTEFLAVLFGFEPAVDLAIVAEALKDLLLTHTAS